MFTEFYRVSLRRFQSHRESSPKLSLRDLSFTSRKGGSILGGSSRTRFYRVFFVVLFFFTEFLSDGRIWFQPSADVDSGGSRPPPPDPTPPLWTPRSQEGSPLYSSIEKTFYRVFPTEFLQTSPAVARRRPARRGTGFSPCVSENLTGFYWVLLGFTGFYWVFLGRVLFAV